jgi:YD repeat-containing protein
MILCYEFSDRHYLYALISISSWSEHKKLPRGNLPIPCEKILRSCSLTLYHRGRHYELFDHSDHRSYIFPIDRNEKEHRLKEIRDEAGHSIRLRYFYGNLAEIIDSAGRLLRVDTDREGRVTKVQLQIDRDTRETLVSYAYGEDGDMTEITDALEQTTRIAYRNHLMVQKTDRNGQTFYWEYDGSKPKSRCIHTWGDSGLLEGRIEYHNGYNLVTDSLGNITRYDYTPDLYVTSVTDQLGAATLTEYTPESDVFREIDAEGNITGYGYNPEGQLTAIHYPDGRLNMERTRGGATTIHFYGANGLKERVLSPDNRITEYFDNEHNLINRIRSGDREITRCRTTNGTTLSVRRFPTACSRNGSTTTADGYCAATTPPTG